MRTNQITIAVHENPADPLRACVHDLRNLFAIVASAKSLLERPLDRGKERLVLDALGRVAVEGKVVTDALLTGVEDRTCGSETSAELRSLISIAGALEHAGLRIEFSGHDDEECWILMAPAEYRANVLELVTNAARAGASRIQIRSARRGCRYWLIVADNGAGFDTQRRVPAQPTGLHGTGLRRLNSAARSAHGTVRIRSQVGRGSVVAVVLPIIRVVSGVPSGEALPAVRSQAR